MARLARVAISDDPMGRRIEKEVDGTTETKYVYDGDHCIAEYDANDALLRKFIHGPAVDEPICMIEVVDSNATYYYHFDALGSVVALTDADANAVQLYEYSVYGQVAASDPNHTNPFLFTGRRFDADTGLYYYRARCYNPYIGRFLQTDPVGYGAGMNLHAYCRNRPISFRDPFGLEEQGYPCAYFDDSSGVQGVAWAILYDGSRHWLLLNGEGDDKWSIAGLSYQYDVPIDSITTVSGTSGLQMIFVDPSLPGGAGPFDENTEKATFGSKRELTSEDVSKYGQPSGPYRIRRGVGPEQPIGGSQEAGEPPYDGRTPPAYGGTPGYGDGWAPRARWPGWDPKKAPPGYEWRPEGTAPGSRRGSWWNPRTGESLHPDLDHGYPVGPHWDYIAPDGKEYRIFPDGRAELKDNRRNRRRM